MTELQAGFELPPISVRLTRETLVRYAGASGDFNRIHYSDAAAHDLGLPTVIAHGMLTMGQVLRVVTGWLGDSERVLSYYARFAKPVPVPDDEEGVLLHVTGVISDVTPDTATIKVDARLGDDKVLSSASVEVTL